MFTALVVLASLLAGPRATPPEWDSLSVSREAVFLDLENERLDIAIRRLLDLAHAKARFEPAALEVAKSLRRTANFRGISINQALWLLVSGESILDVRRTAGIVVVGEPRVTVEIQDLDPGAAIVRLFRSVGCDYCIDYSAMGNKRVTISLKDVPVSDAFKRIMHLVSPDVPYQLVFRHRCYLIMTSAPPAHIASTPDVRGVVARMEAHDRAEAIAAACDCLHRSYYIKVDGAITGTVTVRFEVATASGLYKALICGTQDKLTFEDDGSTLFIYREDLGHGDLPP
jgi:hypothetical protein